MSSHRVYWFGKKRIGWGVGPRHWQGWATVLVYAALMIALPWVFHAASQQMARLVGMAVLTGILLLVMFITGDWRRS